MTPFVSPYLADDVHRFATEQEMETAILKLIGDSVQGSFEAAEAARLREERPKRSAEARETLRDAAAALRRETERSEKDDDPFELN